MPFIPITTTKTATFAKVAKASKVIKAAKAAKAVKAIGFKSSIINGKIGAKGGINAKAGIGANNSIPSINGLPNQLNDLSHGPGTGNNSYIAPMPSIPTPGPHPYDPHGPIGPGMTPSQQCPSRFPDINFNLNPSLLHIGL